MMNKMPLLLYATVIMALLALTGCAGFLTIPNVITTVGSWAADSIVEAETGKSISDNIASDATGKDCELKNVFSKDKPICKPK
jgi:hypothetical protein